MIRTEQKILTENQYPEIISKWKSDSSKIVFTNGCFDIVHLGHIDYLQKARNLGDKLVVGVNSDESVRRLKGGSRPIVDEYARQRMMASFEFVDAVILFGEDTPLRLIQNILPDILVKGNDYSVQNIVGAETVLDNGGNVETIELVKGYSTTAIIELIKNI
ncbi:MAG: D-glycero-beta-D-manno-heptose 1-phosphate adenylyltransferase [Cyclobacteriaceae bacterium]